MSNASSDSTTTTFCKPGVSNASPGKGLEIQRGISGEFRIAPEGRLSDGANTSEVEHISTFKAKFKIPLINSPKTKALLGYEYTTETYHFEEIGKLQPEIFYSLDDNPLRSNKYSFYITQALNHKYYLGLRLRTAFNGDYDRMMSGDSRYLNLSGTAVLGVKPHDDKEWGIGLTYNNGFFRTLVLPFFIYNETFNDKWGIETVLPVSVMARYNMKENSMLLFGAELQTQSYALDVFSNSTIANEAAQPYYFRHAEVAVQVALEQHIHSWFWVSAQAGYHIPTGYRFQEANGAETRYQMTAGAQPFAKISLFLSPPKSLCE
ncbi:MAG TPA: DUF6268 family outer membrane beta-barrel protein [Saprospiraceae bacterium]|nr:DUF6268 family outer membrane beta-barrel protein [Saprospiraceae bacterium]HMQ83941.1 DUF6268 family outer membrane beta-barrel protein [Saprospiraceae bacterium]